MMPGDSNYYGGISYDKFVEQLAEIFLQRMLYITDLQSHKRTTELFREAGYEVILPTVGDHELGGRCPQFWNDYLFASFSPR
jgi:hypothetical protein